jgi:hypothetical protein
MSARLRSGMPRALPRRVSSTHDQWRSSEYERITASLFDALDFSKTIGFSAGQGMASYENGGGLGVLGEVDFYTR